MSNTQTTSSDLIKSFAQDELSEKINHKTRDRIHEVENLGLKAVRERLRKLDTEWDIDKVTNASFASLLVFELLTARRRTKWFLLAQLVQLPIFLMNKKLGIYSPSVVFRILGFRTRREIEQERAELLAFVDRNFPYQAIH
jgi:hypothetical protein